MDEMCKAEEELEEGECSDQEEIGMITNSEVMREPKIVPDANIYRRGCIPQIIINSDQSDLDESDDYASHDDDDEYPSHGKKFRQSSKFNHQNEAPSPFINPLCSSGMAESVAEGGVKKRRNTIWGSVMTEQMLSQDIKQFGVNTLTVQGGRDVESYDFTIAKDDDREEIDIKSDSNDKEDIFGEVVDLEREVKKHQNRKRKRNVKDRLGKRHIKDRLGMKVSYESDTLGQLDVTESDNVFSVTQAITSALREQNITLFTRMVEAVGTGKALELYNKTVDVENSGGMLINNGIRRRTPGGVYIQLLKSEPSIPADVISSVFEQEQQKWQERQKQLRKVKKAARQKWKRHKKLDIDLDRPETPTPPEEFEELDNGNDADADADATDLPDRPDTPEPKDSSDNGSEEEDDEEEDIAVAIAKAKTAILKKQAQLLDSKNQIDEDVSQEIDMT